MLVFVICGYCKGVVDAQKLSQEKQQKNFGRRERQTGEWYATVAVISAEI